MKRNRNEREGPQFNVSDCSQYHSHYLFLLCLLSQTQYHVQEQETVSHWFRYGSIKSTFGTSKIGVRCVNSIVQYGMSVLFKKKESKRIYFSLLVCL